MFSKTEGQYRDTQAEQVSTMSMPSWSIYFHLLGNLTSINKYFFNLELSMSNLLALETLGNVSLVSLCDL